MHFTVLLRSDMSREHNFSFGLVFVPCPVWVRGNEQLLVPDPSTPQYQLGSLGKLLGHEELGAKLEGARSAVVVIHDGGLGTSDDLTALVEDLEKEGFSAQVFGTSSGLAGEG